MQPQPHKSLHSSAQPSSTTCVHLDFDSLHDLTGPVNQICSMSDLILQRYGSDLGADAKTLLGFIQSAAHNLENLMAGLRCYARVLSTPARRRLCDGNAILAAGLLPIQPAIDACGAVVTHQPLPELYCDPTQMSFVF